MSDLMQRVRAAKSQAEAVRILVEAGYVKWEAEETAHMERGTGGLYDVMVNGEFVVSEPSDPTN